MTAATTGARRLVAAADGAAQAEGLRPGLAVAQAQGLVPKLHVVEADPAEDEAALLGLARWAAGYSPLVAVDPPDGLWLDIAGLAHLFGDEAGLLRDLVARLRRQGIAARAAVADAPGTAWAVARFGTMRVVPPGRAVEAVASLPVAALRLDPALVETLHTLGVDRVGQLAAMPRAPMVRRFGADTALRLDRALGQAFEPIDPLMPDEIPSRRLAFAEPLGRIEDLQRVVRRLAERLCRDLARRAEGVRRLDLILRRVDRLKRRPARRHGPPEPGRGPSRETLRRDPARHRSRLRHRGDVLDREPGRAPERAPDNGAGDGRRGGGGRSEPPRRSPRRQARAAQRLSRRPGGEPHPRALDPTQSPLSLRPPRAPGPTPSPARPGSSSRPSPSSRRHSCPTTRRLSSSGAASVTGSRRADGPERIAGEWWRGRGGSSSRATITASRATDGARFWLFRDAPPPIAAGAGGCTGSSHDLCRAPGHDAFLVPARRIEPARTVRAGEAPRHSRRSASSTAIRSPASCGPTRRRRRRACASSSDAGSILPMARRSWSTRPIAPPIRASAACSASARAAPARANARLGWEDVAAWSEGLLAVLLGDDADDGLAADLRRAEGASSADRAYHGPDPPLRRRTTHLRLVQVEQAARAARVPTVAMGDMLYHHPERRRLQDVVSCIRQGCTIDEAGFRLERHADRFLKDPDEMARLFERHPEARGARRTRSSGAAPSPSTSCAISIRARRRARRDRAGKLERLTWEGAETRYPDGVPDRVAAQLRHELTPDRGAATTRPTS